MRTFAGTQNQPQQASAANLSRSNSLAPAASRDAYPLLHLQRTIENQAGLLSLQARADRLEDGPTTEVRSDTPSPAGLAHDFSQIPVHAPAPITIQPKFAVNASGDIYEQEADRISEQVMRMPEPKLQRIGDCGIGWPQYQTEQPSQEHARLQTKSVQASDAGQIEAPTIVHEVLRSPGQPLASPTRAFMEQRFGHDFTGVRVHTDAKAAESARAVNALAYTVGPSVVFGANKYAPHTQVGRSLVAHEGSRLLAHELAHVVQQGSGQGIGTGRNRMVQRSPDEDKSCADGQTVMVYPEKSEQGTCISESEFQQNYIDNYIVLATGLAIPETTWGNIDDDRVPQMRLTYKDGRTLVLEVNDVPLQTSGGGIGIRKGNVRVWRGLRYERRADGMIYPVRGEKRRFVSYVDADNIMSLRAGLHDTIKELKAGMTLIEITNAFASQIAGLGGNAAMNHAFGTGGLFQTVPRKGKPPTGATGGSETNETQKGPAKLQQHEDGPVSPSAQKPTQKLLVSKRIKITSDLHPRSKKLAKGSKTEPQTVEDVKRASTNPSDQAEVRMADRFAEDGHEVKFNADDANGDLTVDGIRTDVKHLNKTDGIAGAIERGIGQGKQVILDGTTVKLTHEQAVAGIRDHEAVAAQHPGKFRNLKTIFIVEGDGRVYVYHRTGSGAAPLKVERIGAGGAASKK